MKLNVIPSFRQMFRTILIEDNISILPTSKDHLTSLYMATNKKYTNRIIPNEGIGIRVKEIKKINGKELVEGCYIICLEFILITYKLFKDEIVEATIIKQDENGIYLVHSIVNTIHVKMLFPGTVKKYFVMKDSPEKHMCWCWTYKNDNFYFKNGQFVRCKIVHVSYTPFLVEARMDDNGLGPKEWW